MVHFKKRSTNDLFDDIYAIFFSEFLYKSTCCGYSFEVHPEVDAIQMGTHNICLYREIDKSTLAVIWNLELLDCVLIGVWAVIRSNTVRTLLRGTAIGLQSHGVEIECLGE